MEFTKEQKELLKKRWDENGDCRSCGWHSAYYEVQHIIEHAFLSGDFEHDGSIYVPCQNPEMEDSERYRQRGSNIYDFKI